MNDLAPAITVWAIVGYELLKLIFAGVEIVRMQALVRATIFGFRLAPILLVIYWAMLFTGTHLPGSSLRGVHFNDKLMHFGAFAGLAFLLAWALPKSIGRINSLVIAAILIMTYAVLDEWTQGFVPNRSPDIHDFFADTLGMLAGFLAYFVLRTILFGMLRQPSVNKRGTKRATTAQR